MINFPVLQRVDCNGLRFYETPEQELYPSITTLLGISMPVEKKQALTNWQNSLGTVKAQAFTKSTADKGTNVHLLIERFLQNEDLKLKDFSVEDVNAFTALKMKLTGIKDIVGQEVSLYSDLLKVAGTCDCIGYYKNKLSIIDFKTATRIKNEKEIYDYKLQCTFYAIAFMEKYDTEINDGVILMTASTGFPLEFSFNINEFVEPLIKRIDEFYEKLNNKSI